MKRRYFIRNSALSIIALQTGSLKSFGNLPQMQALIRFAGYLIPILIEGAVEYIFESYFKSPEENTPSQVVNNSIVKIINVGQNSSNSELKKVSSDYKQHYNSIVIPRMDKSSLNGVGFSADDPKMKAMMNDHKDKASTPVHNVKNLATFDHSTWSKYCDIGNFQTSELNNRIYVNPLDSRPDEYKNVFWVDKQHSFLLYDPSWYCWGLPCSNPNQLSSKNISKLFLSLPNENDARNKE